ncbi:MAG: hypothetical protein NZP72_11430 [Geminicoccaceae bacterium]|nr:hypothetical protein [Geminicoccaceae bacterium]MCS7268114.1 hypothetical protein [Geminicoccaceae bacterium]
MRTSEPARARGGPSGRTLLAWALSVAVLIAATLALFLRAPREVPEGPMRLLLPMNAQEREAWTFEGGRGSSVETRDGLLVLRAAPEDPHVAFHRALVLSEAARGVRLEGEVRFTGRAGAERHAAARIHLWAFDAAGRRLPDQRIDLWQARGDRDWRIVRADLPLPPGAASVRLVLRLQATAGDLQVRRLSASALVPDPRYASARLGLGLGWFLALLAGGVLLWRAAERRGLAAFALVASALGLAAILAPPEAFALLLGGLAPALGRASSTPFLPHALLAASLAILAGRALAIVRLWPAAAVALLLAVAGEVLQLFSDQRQPALDDALANAAGGIFGLWVARTLERLEPARPEPEPPPVELRDLPLVPWPERDGGASRGP